MSEKTIDVTGLGNAIVDIIARTTDEKLAELEVQKGAMTLVDEDRAAYLYDNTGPAIEMSGGSAGNTIAGVAGLGGRAAYIGKVRDDAFGRVFRHDIRALGVSFDTDAASDGPSTAQSLVLVTPDAQRSMNTYLGACVNLTPDDVDEATIAASKVVYLEGYLWDRPHAKDAFRKAATLAHKHGGKVSLTLSDGFCVDRHRAEFLDLVENHVDILFANEDEIIALYEIDDFDAAVEETRKRCEVAALTRSERGSVLIGPDGVVAVPAEKPDRVVDTTGAGDLYAAGVLYGLTRGMDLHTCGRIGGIAAAEVISHYGARPETDLAALMAERLG